MSLIVCGIVSGYSPPCSIVSKRRRVPSMCGSCGRFSGVISANLCVSFMAGHRNEHELDVHRQRAQIAPCQFGASGLAVNFDRDGRLTSAAAALAMKSIDRFSRQSLAAGPFSRELRGRYREGVFQPLFWRLRIADATSAQALFSWSWVDVPKAGVRGPSLLRVPERCMKAAFGLRSSAGRWGGFNGGTQAFVFRMARRTLDPVRWRRHILRSPLSDIHWRSKCRRNDREKSRLLIRSPSPARRPARPFPNPNRSGTGC
jgi:hypothetical protein